MRHVRLMAIVSPAGCSSMSWRRQSARRMTKWWRLRMTVSIRRMTLGSGYEYLMGSVAQSDGASQHASALTRHYAESGTPPGRFISEGLAGLGHGMGIEPGAQVTEEHLFRMLGMVQDPLTGDLLGRPPKAQKPPQAERVTTRISAETAGLKAMSATKHCSRSGPESAQPRRDRPRGRRIRPHQSAPKRGSVTWHTGRQGALRP